MHEAIYADKKVLFDIERAFPGRFKFEDASDGIHEERFTITGDVPEDEFYPWAIRECIAGSCLKLQLMISDLNNHAKLLEWIAKSKGANNL
jgi:hypothetical protein